MCFRYWAWISVLQLTNSMTLDKLIHLSLSFFIHKMEVIMTRYCVVRIKMSLALWSSLHIACQDLMNVPYMVVLKIIRILGF